MGAPVSYTLYCTGSSFNGSGFASLLTNAPSAKTSSMGWNMGGNAPPLYAEMSRSFEIVRTDTSWVTQPSASIPNGVRGNCFAGGPFNGEFYSGSWFITMSFTTSQRKNQVGNCIYRFWKGSDISGSDAQLLSTTFFSSSRASPGTGGGTSITPVTSSNSLPYAVFRNEYLFIQTYWMIVTAGSGAGNNNANEDFIFGNNASLIISPPFVSKSTKIISWGQTDD